jgi:hypothetical protein
MNKGAEVLRFWRDFILKAPEDINGWFGFATVPPVPMFPAEHHMKKVAVVTWCYTGDLGKAEEAFKPIRQFSPPLMDFAGEVPFPVLQSLDSSRRAMLGRLGSSAARPYLVKYGAPSKPRPCHLPDQRLRRPAKGTPSSFAGRTSRRSS